MLILSDREKISRGPVEGLQFLEIGRRLGRDLSGVSWDVARYGGRHAYRAPEAELAAGGVRERPKRLAVGRSPRLRAAVFHQLREGWAPASIAGRSPTDYADDQARRVSREATTSRLTGREQVPPVETRTRRLARSIISILT